MKPTPTLDSYRLVLFDVDQTLLDFDQSENEGMRRLWRHSFQDCVQFQDFRQVYRELNQAVWKEVEQGTLLPENVKEVRAKRVLRHFYQELSQWKSGADVFLQGLSEVAAWLPGAETAFREISRSHKVGLVTNGLRDVQYPRIEKIGIRPLLATYQISEEVGFTKPDAKIFELALEETGCSARETLYVGDSISSDFQGAINAGIDFCWYNPKGQPLPFESPAPKFIFEDWQVFHPQEEMQTLS